MDAAVRHALGGGDADGTGRADGTRLAVFHAGVVERTSEGGSGSGSGSFEGYRADVAKEVLRAAETMRAESQAARTREGGRSGGRRAGSEANAPEEEEDERGKKSVEAAAKEGREGGGGEGGGGEGAGRSEGLSASASTASYIASAMKDLTSSSSSSRGDRGVRSRGSSAALDASPPLTEKFARWLRRRDAGDERTAPSLARRRRKLASVGAADPLLSPTDSFLRSADTDTAPRTARLALDAASDAGLFETPAGAEATREDADWLRRVEGRFRDFERDVTSASVADEASASSLAAAEAKETSFERLSFERPPGVFSAAGSGSGSGSGSRRSAIRASVAAEIADAVARADADGAAMDGADVATLSGLEGAEAALAEEEEEEEAAEWRCVVVGDDAALAEEIVAAIEAANLPCVATNRVRPDLRSEEAGCARARGDRGRGAGGEGAGGGGDGARGGRARGGDAAAVPGADGRREPRRSVRSPRSVRRGLGGARRRRRVRALLMRECRRRRFLYETING